MLLTTKSDNSSESSKLKEVLGYNLGNMLTTFVLVNIIFFSSTLLSFFLLYIEDIFRLISLPFTCSYTKVVIPRKLWKVAFTKSNWRGAAFGTLQYVLGKKKPRSDCPGQVNFALEQVKMEAWWSSWQVKLAPVVLLVDKEWTLHTYWASNILVRATENWIVLAHWTTGFQNVFPVLM